VRAIVTQIRAAVLRRRAQTAVVLVVSLLAGSVSTMALTLLVRSHQPWDDAFQQYNGAHLIFHFDAAKVSLGQLQATTALPGVTTAGPPHETAIVSFQSRAGKGALQLIGRISPGGSIDRIPIAAGRWPERAGEIAVTRTGDSTIPVRPSLGETIRALTTRGTVDFKVVGEVIDLGGHGSELDLSNGVPGAWVMPADIAALVDGQQIRLGYEMAYRFQRAATADDLVADRRDIEAALPAGAETEPVIDWIRMRAGSTWLIVLLSSIILSFTVFALLAVAVIVASVVAGSVLSSYRDIGMAKALGFTPLQLLAIYVGQMAVPALAGALAGLPVGAVASRPFLNDAANNLQLPAPSIFDPVVVIVVPSALMVLVVVAAFVPALRAAATDSVRAIALGSAPRATRRSRLAATLARMRAPRSISIGAGDAFARPVRAGLTLTALGIGIATATFAIGFEDSLIRVLTTDPASYGYAQDLVVHRYPAVGDTTVTDLLNGQPETQTVVAAHLFPARVSGAQDPVAIYGMRGDATALGYRVVEGRWFVAPGDAVIGGAVARAAHVRIGETLAVSLVGGPALALRVVGLMNDFDSLGAVIRVAWQTVATAMPAASPDIYLIKLRAGADSDAYARRITAMSPEFLDTKVTSIAEISTSSNFVTWMVSALALILMAIAAAGVFNAARLTTRERVHDIAILKAVGMTTRQIALMLVASTLVLAVVAALLGVPLGIWLEGVIWTSIGETFGVIVTAGSGFAPLPLALALVAAFGLAMVGGALPARWAAATPVAEVLRSE
jgi:putative ABC transport system permease protein